MKENLIIKMKIITKYYDKCGRLRILRDKPEKTDSIIRFKLVILS